MSADRLPPRRPPASLPPPNANHQAIPQPNGPEPTRTEAPPAELPPPPPVAESPPAPPEISIAISDAPRKAGSSHDEIHVRRLSSTERTQRRLVKNAILFGVCIVVLVMVFYMLAR